MPRRRTHAAGPDGQGGARFHDAVTADERRDFAAAMARLGPFEATPALAVAVSGGADSLALLILLADWGRSRACTIRVLTVDHGLRPEAAGEARQVADVAEALSACHVTLRWRGPHPESGLQEAAREARYDLMTAWCRERGILHLFTAHHADDMSETLLMRLGRGSGVDGLAGIPDITAMDGVRVLRPLLSNAKSALAQIVARAGIDWAEDPSNRDPRFERARLRGARPSMAALGLSPDGLVRTARRMESARAALEAATADRLGIALHRLDGRGFALVDATRLVAPPDDVARRALARLVQCFGGARHPPRHDRVVALVARIRAFENWRGATLGGCRLKPSRGGHVLVQREAARIREEAHFDGHNAARWDGRFHIRLHAPVGRASAMGLRIRALDPEMLGRAPNDDWRSACLSLPKSVVPTLPALCDSSAFLAAPSLGIFSPRMGDIGVTVRFCPHMPLTDRLSHRNPLSG